MALINSTGQYMVIRDIEMNHVVVDVYASQEKTSSLNPYFEKSDSFSIHLPMLRNRLKEETASGTGGKTKWTNILLTVEAIIVEAAADPTFDVSLPAKEYPHDWTVAV